MSLTLQSTFGGTYGNNITLRSVLEERNPDIGSNTSIVNVCIYLDTNVYSSLYGLTNIPLTINMGNAGGSSTFNIGINIGKSSSALIFAKDYVVTHDSNGSKLFQYTAELDVNISGYSFSTHTGSMTLTTLARSSSISASDFTIGSSEEITINRADSSFKHTLRYSWYGTSGTIASNVDTSYSWSVPMTFCNNVANATSGSCTIYCDTYSSSTLIGTQSITVNAKVPSSVIPTLTSITLADTNYTASQLITGSNYVQIISNISVTFNGEAGSYGSTITGLKAEIVGKNQSVSSDGGTLGLMNFSGSATIRAYVIDSRGRTSAYVTSDINVLPYAPPSISFLVNRVGADQKTLQIVRNVSISPLTVNSVQKNTMNLSFSTAPVSTGTYTTDNGSAGGTFTSVATLVNSSANLGNVYQTDTSYFVKGVLSDAFTSTSFSAKIGTISVNISISKNGVGIKKVWEQGAVDVLGAIYSNGSQIQHYQLTSNDGTLLTATSDWNTVIKTGFYTGSGLTNSPIGGDSLKTVLVIGNVQQAFDSSGIVSAYRTLKNGVWSSWSYYAVQNTANSFTTVLQTQKFTTAVSLPYGVTGTATRIGNLVSISVDSVITTSFASNAAISMGKEILPAGYRPVNDIEFLKLSAYSSGTLDTGADGLIGFKPNGEIWYKYKNVYNPWLLKGSLTYLTMDAFPS